ncbi:MAG: HNH endonuclease [Limnochordia bacterium]|jgi:hypothetical protein|nr:HNH endonuclease [Limnochordia bacterium]
MAHDLITLAHRVEKILPDPLVRATQLEALADSLTYAQARNSAIWLVHVRSDRIRLFTGRLIVLTLMDRDLWVTTDASENEDSLSGLRSWAWDTQSYPRYKRPPSRNGFYNPRLDRERDWLAIQTAHFSYLDHVLARYHTVDPRSVARHEPLITEYLSIVLGRPMPGMESPLVSEPMSDAAGFREGSTTRVPVNRFERNHRAREECLRHHGHNCIACGMSFYERYGPEMDGFIHVHHLIPLSEIRQGYYVDPIRDLVPVCPNCHAALHAEGGAVRSIEEVRKMLKHQQKKCL